MKKGDGRYKKGKRPPPAHRCGDAGGRTEDGRPCGYATQPGSTCWRHPADPADRPLTTRQQRFINHYLATGNGVQSAIAAGYSEKAAGPQATENLQKANVARALAAAEGRIQGNLEITAERTLREVARIAFGDLRNLVTWSGQQTRFRDSADLTDDEAAAVSGVKAKHTVFIDPETGEERHTHEVELRTYDKLSALQKLIKHLGLEAEMRAHLQVDVTEMAALSDEQLLKRTMALAGRVPKGVLEEAFKGHGNGHGPKGNGKRGNGRK